jgi:hypothetical protein
MLTAPDIARMSSDEVDHLFRQGEVGQIPEGTADGLAIFRPGSAIEPVLGKVVHDLAWQGKVIDSQRRTLKNRVSPLGVRAIAADVYRAPSWHDGKDCIVLDYMKRSLVARFIRDEIRRVAPGLYLGLVFVRRRRVLYFTLQFAT